MHYEINVSYNRRHVFATAERSLTTLEEVRDLLAEFQKVFTTERGYAISVHEVETVSKQISLNEFLPTGSRRN